MPESIKERLLRVEPQKLVDLIFDLASDNDVSWSKIERLISKPTDNSKRFLRRLNEIKNRDGFVPWKNSSQFSDELSDLLADLDSGVSSPEEGFQLICEFYHADEQIFNYADDSSGHIGGVFRDTATDLFIKFASLISDKTLVVKTVLELIKDDGYGVREEIITHANKFLSLSDLQNLLDLLFEGHGDKNGQVSSWQLESIAKQLGDAPLYENLVRKYHHKITARDLSKIAEVYFETGNISKAQEILDSVDQNDVLGKTECEDIQKRIYSKLGKKDELFKISYRAFQNYTSEYTLNDLISIAGEHRREDFIQEAVSKILSKTKWDYNSAEFLAKTDQLDSLEVFVKKHRQQIEEGVLYSALEIAEYLVNKNSRIAASIIYRGLITETLKKSISKYYHHAVNYLEVLDKITPKINDWNGVEDHSTYLQNLKKKHALKKSLWSQYKK